MLVSVRILKLETKMEPVENGTSKDHMAGLLIPLSVQTKHCYKENSEFVPMQTASEKLGLQFRSSKFL
jgi:hypothetical protein